VEIFCGLAVDGEDGIAGLKDAAFFGGRARDNFDDVQPVVLA
jgi:hypothetical protein